MKKIVLLSTAAMLGILSSNTALAFDFNLSHKDAGAKTGIVVGGNLGYSFAQNKFTSYDGNFAGGIFAGYDYAFSKHYSLGVEADWQYAYQIDKQINDDRISIWSIPIFAVGKYYIHNYEAINLFGKLGYAYNHTSNFGEDTLWRPVAAIGAGYDIGDFNIFAQYQYNWLDHGEVDFGQGTVSLGLSYTFGLGKRYDESYNAAIGKTSVNDTSYNSSYASSTNTSDMSTESDYTDHSDIVSHESTKPGVNKSLDCNNMIVHSQCSHKAGTYCVKACDTLLEIAHKHGTTVEAIMASNPSIKNKNIIYAGKDINIPAHVVTK